MDAINKAVVELMCGLWSKLCSLISLLVPLTIHWCNFCVIVRRCCRLQNTIGCFGLNLKKKKMQLCKHWHAWQREWAHVVQPSVKLSDSTLFWVLESPKVKDTVGSKKLSSSLTFISSGPHQPAEEELDYSLYFLSIYLFLLSSQTHTDVL